MPLETEIKLVIEVADLPALLGALPDPVAVKELRNEYFDTPDRALGARMEMLRLRFREGSDDSVLCFKGPGRSRGGVFQAAEHEWTLNAHEAQAFMESPSTQEAHLQDFISDEILTRIQSIGAMHVRRVCVAYGRDQLLEIDHVRYPDGFEDAEIEVEVSPEDIQSTRTVLGKLLAETELAASDQSQTKYARFLAHGGGA